MQAMLEMGKIEIQKTEGRSMSANKRKRSQMGLV